MKNRILKLGLMLSAFALFIACNNDDAQGDSTWDIPSPSLNVSLDFANSQTLVEAETTYGFTVSLSEAQLVDVVVNLTQTGGDATDGVDFSFPHSLRIPAGLTSVSDVIAIHADELVEDTETATIRITNGTESNVSIINEQVVSFSIMNLTGGDLAIGLDWAATGFQFPDGSAFSPYDLADLRLLVSTGPNNTDLIGGADGSSAESWTMSSTTPDGEYYVVADFFDAMDETFDIDLTLTFDQVGVINHQTHTFGGALNGNSSCGSVFFVLAKITKTGDSYAFEELGSNSPVTSAPFIGTATVTADDWADYSIGDTVEIEAGTDAQEFWIRSYTNPFITNTATAYMVVTIDPLTANVTVQSNEDFDYGVPIDITGTGSVNACAGSIELTISFWVPGSVGVSGYAFDQAFNLQL